MSTRYILLLLLLSALSFTSSGNNKAKRLAGQWQVQPIVVDGKNNDWPSPYPEYDEKAMLGYNVSNDKDNLYITVETGDPATQLKILQNGLTVWIDRKGEQNELTAINFPIPGDAAGRPANGKMVRGNAPPSTPDEQRFYLEDRVREAMAHANEYSLQGFKSCNLQYPIAENDSCGMITRIAIDGDYELVWEAVIPFRAFYFKNEIGRSDRGRPLSICFETTGSPKPEGQSNAANNPSRGGGIRPSVGFGVGGFGIGMGNGGGARNGRGGNNTTIDMMEPLYRSSKTWKRFGIAFP